LPSLVEPYPTFRSQSPSLITPNSPRKYQRQDTYSQPILTPHPAAPASSS
jgi:hypothetical protein